MANVLFGLNVWAWAVLGLTAVDHDEKWHLVRWCIAAIHLAVGTLFLIRRPVIRNGSATEIIKAIPAVVLSGVAFGYAGSCSRWPFVAIGLFVLGTVITVAAFAALAGNFAVLPAVRGLTNSGPYRWVRHPAYLGETILVLACCVARIDAFSISILLTTIAAVVVRIRAEETMFAKASAEWPTSYATYRQAVRYRLVPGLW